MPEQKIPLKGFDPTANSFTPEKVPTPQRRAYGPSNGCNRCRLRRVKCDETHPSCERCLKSGFQCVYRDQFDRVLRDQTEGAAETAQRKWRSRATISSIRRGNPINPQQQGNSSPGPSRSLTPPIQDLSRQRFLFDFVVPIDETPDHRGVTSYGSYFAFVPGMYSRANEDSCVSLALSAVASANFGSRCISSQAHIQGLTSYGKALRILNRALQEPQQRITFDELAASCLLALYDLVSPPHVGTRSSWGTHVKGASALLVKKYEGDHHIREVAGLLQTVCTQMILSNMVVGTRPAIPLEVCLRFAPPNGPSATLLGHLYETANISADWRGARADYCNDQVQLLLSAADIVARGQDLDEAMMTWMYQVLGQQKFEILENCSDNVPTWLRPLYSLPGAPTILHRYNSIHVSHQWQFCRASRLVLLGTVISAVEKLLALSQSRSDREEYDDVKKKLQLRMLDLVDGLCQGTFTSFTISIAGKSEPQGFADVPGVRGYQLIWPMGRAGICLVQEYLRELDVSDRLAWVRSTLACLRDDLGLRRAQEYVDYMDGPHIREEER